MPRTDLRILSFYLQKFLVLFDFCFTALQHILGYFERGQLT